MKYVLDSIFEYLQSTLNGSDSTADVLIYCRNGVLSTHRLVLASISKMLLSVFKEDTWDEPIALMLADFAIEEVVEYFNDFYKNGSKSARFIPLSNILGVQGFSNKNHEDFEKITNANFRENNVSIAEKATIIVREKEILNLKTEDFSDGEYNYYEGNQESCENLETLELKFEVELDEIQHDGDNQENGVTFETYEHKLEAQLENIQDDQDNKENGVALETLEHKLEVELDEIKDFVLHKKSKALANEEEKDNPYFTSTDLSYVVKCSFCHTTVKKQNFNRHLKTKHNLTMEDKRKERKKTSEAWQFFEIDEENSKSKCKLCSVEIKISKYTASKLVSHLRHVHPHELSTINIRKMAEADQGNKFDESRDIRNEEAGNNMQTVEARDNDVDPIEVSKTAVKEKAKSSEARQYFTEDPDDNGHSFCNLCQLRIVNKSKIMRVHLMYKHTDIYSTLKRHNVVDHSQKKLGQYYSENPNDPSKYNCNICNASITKCNIFRHINNLHSIFEDGQGPKQLLCSFCGKEFKDKWTRDLHEDTQHKKIYRHNCSICGKGYLNKKMLNEHMLRHTDDKPFQCSDCGQQFTHSGSLRFHEQAKVCSRYNVSGITSLTCPSCDKEFLTPAKLKIHLLRSSLCTLDNKKKPFACEHCERSFISEKYLEIHMRSHTGETPYQCEKCSKRFKFLRRLNYHKCISEPGI